MSRTQNQSFQPTSLSKKAIALYLLGGLIVLAFFLSPVFQGGTGGENEVEKQAVASGSALTPALTPAFPGAQGDGAETKGGRAGKVLIVDRLDDPCPATACTTEALADPQMATPGTLRWALLQDYPRTVVFSVSGIIRLQEDLTERVGSELHVKRLANIPVISPFLTVAGQTSPAGGITIVGNGVNIRTHDVVMRYLRFRTGRGEQPVYKDQQTPETLMIGNGAERVLIDHCSFSWMPAEGVSVYTGESWDGSVGTAKDITLSWNIIGEGLIQHADGRGHPSGAFMSGFDGGPEYAAQNITLHHNLFLHTQKRNGDLLSYNGRLVNNLFYNWQWLPMVIAGGVKADIVGNVWKPGPQTEQKAGDPTGIHLVPADADLPEKEAQDWWHAVSGTPSLFLEGNAFGGAQQVLLNQRDVLCYYRTRGEDCRKQALDDSWFRQQPVLAGQHVVLPDTTDVAERKVLEQAGLSQRINLSGKWVANRDPVDERYIKEYQTGSYIRGKFPWHEKEVGGYPQQIEGAGYPDQDQDGMSDIWEVKNGLNPGDPKDAVQRAKPDGYTHLELFINGGVVLR